MDEKIKILFLASNPKDIHPLKLDKEVREIDGKIQIGTFRDAFDLKSQWAMRPSDLQEVLLRFQPHIVHFSGHGSHNEEIMLEDDDGNSHPVGKQALTNLFKLLKDNVRVVVLNACFSHTQAEAISETIDFTIGTSKAINDSAAIGFASSFYRALAFGRSVRTAFDLANNQLDLSNISGSDIPRLFVRTGANEHASIVAPPAPPAVPQPQAKDPLTALEAIFVKLSEGKADDADRRAFRRAMFDGKIILAKAQSEGEDRLSAADYKLGRYRDLLHIELKAEAHRRLQEQLYTQPFGLPPPLPGSIFVGRECDLAEIRRRLGFKPSSPQAGNLTVVRGWPGVGKTTLVSVISRDPDLALMFPDGVLWTYLDQQPELFSKLAAWERALTGTDEMLSVPTLSEATARLADLLRDRRMLLVIDDVWEVTHAAPFLQAGAASNCALLVTTRLPDVADNLAPDHSLIYRLPVLSEESALLLLRHLAPSIVEQHEELCRQMVSDLEYLPLSLHVAGRLLRREIEMGFDVVESINEIRAGTARFIEEDAPPDRLIEGRATADDPEASTRPSLKALLQRSTERLDEHTRECFAFLGAFAPKPATFDLAAMKAVWQVADPRPIVRKLVGFGLLEPVGSARFQMHALLVKHAESLLSE
jgi:hypothetical protein